MAEPAAAPEPTVKSYDITKGQFVDKPASSATNPVDPAKPDPEEEEAKPADPAHGAGGEPKKEDPKPGDPPKEDPKPTFEPGSYLSSKWGEKGIKTEADVDTLIGSHLQLQEQAKGLQTELEKVKNEPKYRTEQEKRIAEFLAPFDPNKFGEGLNTAAELMAMDPDNVAAKRAMEESFILKHPDLTRDEAKELFNENFSKRYALNRDDFDTQEAYDKRKRIVDIEMKQEESQARKDLKEKREALKYVAPKEDPSKVQAGSAPKVPESQAGYEREIDLMFDDGKGGKFDRFNYLNEDGKEQLFSLVFDAEKLGNMKTFMKTYLQNPGSYAADGKIANFAPATLAKLAARILYGDWMEEEILKQSKTIAAKLKAEQIAGQSPEKKSGAQGDVKLSIDEQWASLAEKAKKERGGR